VTCSRLSAHITALMDGTLTGVSAIKLCRRRGLIVLDGRLFELLAWHTKRRGEENAAVGALQNESL